MVCGPDRRGRFQYSIHNEIKNDVRTFECKSLSSSMGKEIFVVRPGSNPIPDSKKAGSLPLSQNFLMPCHGLEVLVHLDMYIRGMFDSEQMHNACYIVHPTCRHRHGSFPAMHLARLSHQDQHICFRKPEDPEDRDSPGGLSP